MAFFIRLSISFAIGLATLATQAQPSLQSIELAKTVPIADVHMHTYRFRGAAASEYLDEMNKNGVSWGGGVGDYREDVATLLGSRYIPAVGQAEFMKVFFSDGQSGLVDASNPVFLSLFEKADQLMASGRAKGFGELHTDNSSSGPPRIRRHIRTDNPVMRKFYEIANRYSGFVQIHSQLDGDFVGDILRLTEDYPNALTILSHCLPKSRPKDLQALFSQRSNLVCELSAQGGVQNRLAGLQRPARVFSAEGIEPQWKVFIEEYQDRIMIGTDACCGWFNSYSELVAELRSNLLPHLEPEVLEKIAYKNAARLLDLK